MKKLKLKIVFLLEKNFIRETKIQEKETNKEHQGFVEE